MKLLSGFIYRMECKLVLSLEPDIRAAPAGDRAWTTILFQTSYKFFTFSGKQVAKFAQKLN